MPERKESKLYKKEGEQARAQDQEVGLYIIRERACDGERGEVTRNREQD